jgi:hypothetical protein
LTSNKRKPGKPISSVELKVSLRIGKGSAEKVRELVPEAKIVPGGCVLQFRGDDPGAVADETQAVLEKLRPLIRDLS